MSEVKNARGALAAGGLAALLASTCCLGPLVLVTLGFGGAWIGNLTALEPYRPVFLGAAGNTHDGSQIGICQVRILFPIKIQIRLTQRIQLFVQGPLGAGDKLQNVGGDHFEIFSTGFIIITPKLRHIQHAFCQKISAEIAASQRTSFHRL